MSEGVYLSQRLAAKCSFSGQQLQTFSSSVTVVSDICASKFPFAVTSNEMFNEYVSCRHGSTVEVVFCKRVIDLLFTHYEPDCLALVWTSNSFLLRLTVRLYACLVSLPSPPPLPRSPKPPPPLHLPISEILKWLRLLSVLMSTQEKKQLTENV